MKKTLIVALLATTALFGACSVKPEPAPHVRYTAIGRYYLDGTVVTADGNIWGYSADTISDKTPTDGMPVHVAFDDNGTANNITDDIILGLVWDVETAIYDDLETVLSEAFTIERDGNNIHVTPQNN